MDFIKTSLLAAGMVLMGMTLGAGVTIVFIKVMDWLAPILDL